MPRNRYINRNEALSGIGLSSACDDKRGGLGRRWDIYQGIMLANCFHFELITASVFPKSRIVNRFGQGGGVVLKTPDCGIFLLSRTLDSGHIVDRILALLYNMRKFRPVIQNQQQIFKRGFACQLSPRTQYLFFPLSLAALIPHLP